jgi:hypothetical protein
MCLQQNNKKKKLNIDLYNLTINICSDDIDMADLLPLIQNDNDDDNKYSNKTKRVLTSPYFFSTHK